MVLIRGMNDEGSDDEPDLLPAVLPPGSKLIDPDKATQRKDRGRIMPWRKVELMRELADPKRTQAAMAEDHGVTGVAITLFKQRNASEIAKIKANIDDQFVGLWIAEKMNRIATYQASVEAIETKEQRNGATMADADMLRVKFAGLRAVAEELGQLPARVNVTVTPVEHIIVGVNPGDLQ